MVFCTKSKIQTTTLVEKITNHMLYDVHKYIVII